MGAQVEAEYEVSWFWVALALKGELYLTRGREVKYDMVLGVLKPPRLRHCCMESSVDGSSGGFDRRLRKGHCHLLELNLCIFAVRKLEVQHDSTTSFSLRIYWCHRKKNHLLRLRRLHCHVDLGYCHPDLLSYVIRFLHSSRLQLKMFHTSRHSISVYHHHGSLLDTPLKPTLAVNSVCGDHPSCAFSPAGLRV
ncbi:hypothetical protein Mapa_006605 [Marchantia paleacea]|nr:hypothetical protein Mapa_006605 [Marchantia paleacea]